MTEVTIAWLMAIVAILWLIIACTIEGRRERNDLTAQSEQSNYHERL